jgi:hypothetical protein
VSSNDAAEVTGEDRADARLIWDFHQLPHEVRPCSAASVVSEVLQNAGIEVTSLLLISMPYLRGTGGMRYLDDQVFTQRHITDHAFRPPSPAEHLWKEATQISALWALARYGPSIVQAALDDLRATA